MVGQDVIQRMEEHMLAAIGGMGIFGFVVLIAIVLTIVYFVRRA